MFYEATMGDARISIKHCFPKIIDSEVSDEAIKASIENGGHENIIRLLSERARCFENKSMWVHALADHIKIGSLAIATKEYGILKRTTDKVLLAFRITGNKSTLKENVVDFVENVVSFYESEGLYSRASDFCLSLHRLKRFGNMVSVLEADLLLERTADLACFAKRYDHARFFYKNLKKQHDTSTDIDRIRLKETLCYILVFNHSTKNKKQDQSDELSSSSIHHWKAKQGCSIQGNCRNDVHCTHYISSDDTQNAINMLIFFATAKNVSLLQMKILLMELVETFCFGSDDVETFLISQFEARFPSIMSLPQQ